MHVGGKMGGGMGMGMGAGRRAGGAGFFAGELIIAPAPLNGDDWTIISGSAITFPGDGTVVIGANSAQQFATADTIEPIVIGATYTISCECTVWNAANGTSIRFQCGAALLESISAIGTYSGDVVAVDTTGPGLRKPNITAFTNAVFTNFSCVRVA